MVNESIEPEELASKCLRTSHYSMRDGWFGLQHCLSELDIVSNHISVPRRDFDLAFDVPSAGTLSHTHVVGAQEDEHFTLHSDSP